eukprot:gene10634-14279_t
MRLIIRCFHKSSLTFLARSRSRVLLNNTDAKRPTIDINHKTADDEEESEYNIQNKNDETSFSKLKLSGDMYQFEKRKTKSLNKPTDYVQLLDVETHSSSYNPKANNSKSAKLSQPLVKPPAKIESAASQGYFATLNEEISDILNTTLTSQKFRNIFINSNQLINKSNKTKNKSENVVARPKQFTNNDHNLDLVEISDVVIDKEFSQIIAWWRSDVIKVFLLEVHKKLELPQFNKLVNKMTIKITNKLQKSESLFRSELIKEMDFRRVPRIMFKSQDAEYFRLKSKS